MSAGEHDEGEGNVGKLWRDQHLVEDQLIEDELGQTEVMLVRRGQCFDLYSTILI